MFTRSKCLWGRLKTIFGCQHYLFAVRRNNLILHQSGFHSKHKQKHFIGNGWPAALSFCLVKYYCKDDDEEDTGPLQSSAAITDNDSREHSTSKNLLVSEKDPLSEVKQFFGSKSSESDTKENTRPRETGGIFTVPNALCFFRLGVSPYIAYLVVVQRYTWALGLTFAAGFTDLIDGWIARNFKNQSSILGTYIDPLADKVLISSLVLSLTYAGIIPIPLCALMVGRDVAIMTASFYLHFTSLSHPRTLEKFLDFKNAVVRMEPTEISKWNTTFQLLLVAASLGAPVFKYIGSPLLKGLWLLVGATTILSGLSYVIKDTSSYIVK